MNEFSTLKMLSRVARAGCLQRNGFMPKCFYSAQAPQSLEVSQDDGLRVIKLNRPSKLNAFNEEMYRGMKDELEKAAMDEKTVITALTGSGDYFSSGNDLSMFQPMPKSLVELEELAARNREVLELFVNSFIDFPKPLVGVLNGPAIGIGGTIIGLMDMVYASDRVTLSFPFVKLGQSPEACSSYIFPSLMGDAKAGELIYFGRKIDAHEAERLGLVTRVIPHQDLDTIWTELRDYSKLPKDSLLKCKELLKGVKKDTLKEVNRKECDILQECWASPQTFKMVEKMFLKRKK